MTFTDEMVTILVSFAPVISHSVMVLVDDHYTTFEWNIPASRHLEYEYTLSTFHISLRSYVASK